MSRRSSPRVARGGDSRLKLLEQGVRASGYHPLAFSRLSAERRPCRLTSNLAPLARPPRGAIAHRRAVRSKRTRLTRNRRRVHRRRNWIAPRIPSESEQPRARRDSRELQKRMHPKFLQKHGQRVLVSLGRVDALLPNNVPSQGKLSVHILKARIGFAAKVCI